MSAQAQKFEIFEKSSLWVFVVRDDYQPVNHGVARAWVKNNNT